VAIAEILVGVHFVSTPRSRALSSCGPARAGTIELEERVKEAMAARVVVVCDEMKVVALVDAGWRVEAG
jgi:hypothetical protein